MDKPVDGMQAVLVLLALVSVVCLAVAFFVVGAR